jgi:tRNA(fMet)-specific endonuclease VapC
MILLDTSVIIELTSGNEDFQRRLRDFSRRSVGASAIALLELERGIALSEREYRKVNRAALSHVLRNIQIKPFDRRAATKAGALFALWQQGGNMKGIMDGLIASHAASLGATLIYVDGDFDRAKIKGLQRWAKSSGDTGQGQA